MRSVREYAVPPEPARNRPRNAPGAAAVLFATAILAGCAGASPGPFEETEDLKAFLKGEAPVPEERAELARLNEAFATQSVRAHGYVREGIDDDETPDGWSPVVRGEDREPADITPWLESGDIDPAGRFVPTAELCEGSGPASIEGLPEDALRIDGLQDRVARLSCAALRLEGGATEIQWSEPSAAALSIAEDGAIFVNPRVLHLILTDGEVAAADSIEAPGMEPASAGPEDDDLLIDIDEGDHDHHPRPPPDPDDGGGSTDAEDIAECADTCAKSCEVLIAVLDACDSGEATSSDAQGGCETQVPGEDRGPFQAILFSLALVCAVAFRRRGAGRNSRRALFLAPFFVLFFNGALARAQAPAKPPPPPSAQAPAKPDAQAPAKPAAPDPAEPAPPPPPKDWKQLEQEGMKQLEEKNYGEAIRLLQEAYLLDPTADKLEAIARAQRGAGQTHKAIRTLEHVRAQFGESLTEEKYEAITAEIEKLKGELVTIRIISQPLSATISIDGEDLPPGAAATPLEIGPGTHKFGARAEGYATGYRTIDIVPGRETRDVILKLPPTKLFLWITASDGGAAISVDEKEVGKGEWSGFVEPGEHTVRIEQPGGEAQTIRVSGAAGEAKKIPDSGEPLTYPGMPEPERERPATDFSSFTEEPAPTELRETGPYFLANASILWDTTRLYGFERANGVPGVAVGVRGGYRPYSTLSFEMLAEYSYFGRTDELTQNFNRDEDGDGVVDPLFARDDATYSIHDIRIGPVLRGMSSGTKHRGLFGLGLGVLYERIGLDHVDYVYDEIRQEWNGNDIYHHDYSGLGAFLLVEAGYERSIGRLLLGAVFNVFVDAVSGIEGEPYNKSYNVRLGAALRIGYANWKIEKVAVKKTP
ncbi:MAG: PEGA domain-containing protein [Polyangiaceae bacterium]|nr:PEGA domain-containing protein [Polyangiaceae bacterium]